MSTQTVSLVPLGIDILLLWNHSYSWGPMFVDCQNFAVSWERDLEGKWFVELHCKTILYFVKVRGNVNSWVRMTHEIHEH